MSKIFHGANVFLAYELVDSLRDFAALHNALKDNGAKVYGGCDPSRNGPNDYHIISCSEHEKFEDLKSKGCKMLGTRCVLACAKEQRPLPEQGFTCCLAMDGVKVLASGFDANEKINIKELVTGMGGALNTKVSPDLNFVIVKNVLAAKYQWALNILKKPIVTYEWLQQCSDEHRVVPHESYMVLPFSGLKICVTGIPADKRKEMEKLTKQNGGKFSADLTKKCTHLISDAPGSDKHKAAKHWGHIHIVTMKWFDQSIARRACLKESHYTHTEIFHGANVFLSRELVSPQDFDALQDAVKDNGARIHLCCDPSSNGPNDYHIISGSEHEKFEDLKSKGCKMLGPTCVLECAKEGRPLPNQGFPCCRAMDGVKVLASGFDANEKTEIEELVTGMSGALNTQASPDLNFVVVKNFLAADDLYQWALDILQKPMVSYEWLKQCSDEHRVVPHESYKVLPFSGLHICAKGISSDKHEEIETLTLQNGGKYSADIAEECTHFISDAPERDIEMVAKLWSHIVVVTREWFYQSIARKEWQSLLKDRVAGICTASQFSTQAVKMISEMPSQFPSQPHNSRNTANDHVGSGVDNMLKDAGEVRHPPVPDVADAIEDVLKQLRERDQRSPVSTGCATRVSFNCDQFNGDNPNPHTVFGLSKYWLNRKDDEGETSRKGKAASPTYSLTDSDSQVVTYAIDRSGIQLLLDRVRDRNQNNMQ